MSDIWENRNEPERPHPSKIFENAEEKYNNLRNWREENKERYGIELSNEGFMAMNYLSQYAADDEEYVNNMYRFATAKKLSETRGLPFEYAFVNLDSLMESQYPNVKGEKSWFKAVGDSFALGTNTGIMAGKAWELRFAGTPEERNKIWEEIRRLSEENLDLKDGVTRDMFTEGLKAFGESWSFMAKGAVASYLGGLINPAVGFIASGAMSAKDMIGLEYISLLEQGVDDETAWKTAIASGSIQGVFEAISDPMSVIPGKGAGQFIFKRLHFAGKIGAFARAAAAETIDIALEGGTEYVQEAVSQGFTETAKQATEKKVREIVAGGGMEPLEKGAEDLATSAYREYLKIVAESDTRDELLFRESASDQAQARIESLKAGILAAFVTGAVGLPRKTFSNIKDMRQIKTAAKIAPDVDSFIKMTEGNKSLDDLNEENRKDFLQKVWDTTAAEARPDIQERAETQGGPAPGNPGRSRRMEDGGLYTQLASEREGARAEMQEAVADDAAADGQNEIPGAEDGAIDEGEAAREANREPAKKPESLDKNDTADDPKLRAIFEELFPGQTMEGPVGDQLQLLETKATLDLWEEELNRQADEPAEQATKRKKSGITEDRLLIGDPAGGSYYGGISFRRDGDTILVDSVEVRDFISDRDDVAREALLDLAYRFPGLNIEWNPAEPGLMDVRDRLVAENPRGPDKGLQWFAPGEEKADALKKAGIARSLKNFNIEGDENRAATELVYQTATALGVRPEDVGRDVEFMTTAQIRANPELAAMLDDSYQRDVAAQGNKAGRWNDPRVAGGIFFVRDGGIVSAGTAAREFGQGIKAVIYAAENADFSTFAHEWFHYIDAAFIARSPYHRGLFEKAMGKRYEDFTAKDREYLATHWEEYLRTGKAPNEGLRGLFRQIARAMAKALNSLRDIITLSPDLTKAFDALLVDAASPLAKDGAAENAEAGADLAAQRGDLSKNPEAEAALAEELSDTARKEFDRYAQTLARKYDGMVFDDGAGRKRVSFENEQAVYEAVQDLRKRPEVVRLEDGLIKTRDAGDMAAAVRLFDGSLAELRLNTRENFSRNEPGVLFQMKEDDRKHGATAALIERAGEIADPAARERVIRAVRELREQYAGTDAEYRAPNGAPSLLLEALGEETGKQAWYAVRTPDFKRWFGDWETAALIDMAERVWKGDMTASRINFAASDKLKSEIKKLLGHEIQEVFITDSDIRHIKKRHGANQDTEGQVNITPEDIALIPFVMNEFDSAEQDQTDRLGNRKFLFKKQIDGTAYVASIERGPNKEQVITLWKTKSRVPRADALGPTSETTPATEIIQRAEDLRNSKNNVSKATDANGEPLVVFRGDKAGLDRFLNRQGIYHASDAGVAGEYASGGLYKNFLNIKNPLVLDSEGSFDAVRDAVNDMVYDILEQDWSELEHNRQFQTLRRNYLAFRNEEGSSVRDFYNDFLPEVSEETDEEEFKEILLKSLHDANSFRWEQIDFRDIDILNPYIQTLGYDGIIRPYDPLGQTKGKEYITFSPPQIKSATDNAGTYGNDEASILYQLTEPELREDALRFDSWQAWKQDVEQVDWVAESYAPEGLSEAEKDAWYKAAWEKAHNISRDADGNAVNSAAAKTTKELNAEFDAVIEGEGELESFMERVDIGLTFDDDYGAVDEADAEQRERNAALRDKLDRQVHPFIKSNAKRVRKGKALKPEDRKKILTLMHKGAAHYRALYAELMEDEYFGAAAEQEIKSLPDIIDPKGRGLSITELTAEIQKIQDEKIREELLRGNYVPGEIEGYIGRLEGEIKAAQKKLEEAEARSREDAGDYSRLERSYDRIVRERIELEETIGNYEASLADMEAALDKLKSKQKTELLKQKNKAARKLEEAKSRGKLDTETRKERLSAAREKRRELIGVYEKRITDERERILERKAELKALNKDAADALREINKEALAGGSADVILQKQTAMQTLRAQIRMKQAEKRAAAKITAYKRKLVNRIMKEPSGKIWHEYREKIRAIQRFLQPKVSKAKIRWDGEVYDIEVFRDKVEKEGIIDILPKGLVQRLFTKSIDKWTVAELEEMAAEVRNLEAAGKLLWEEKEHARLVQQGRDRLAVLRQNANNPGYKPAAAGESKERKDQVRKANARLKQILSATWTFPRIANWLDGGKDGAYTELLVTRERKAYKVKWDNADRRYAVIDDFMKARGMKIPDLYTKAFTIAGVGPEGSDATFTLSDLMYMYIGLRDEKTREAILYGNLMNQAERSGMLNKNKILGIWGARKLQLLTETIQEALGADERALAELIARDFRDEFGRLNDVFANEFNQVMSQVRNYVPMLRLEPAAAGEVHEQQQAQEILNVAGTSIKRTPNKGFTITRIEISPKYQRAIALDLYGTWRKAVERQEHFAAYTGYIRDLNAVFKSRNLESRLIQEQITQIYGSDMLRRINAEINALANPSSFKDDANIERLLRTMRGHLAVGYLAFNIPSVLKQFTASPLPYLAHVNPLELVSSAFKFMRNPRAFSETIRQKSAIMRQRQASTIIADLRKAQETNKGKKGLSLIGEIGMKGLEIADWTSVSIGWNAVYERALREGLSEEAAIARADDVTIKTQPSGREQDLSPLFKNQPEAMKLITQFTTSLNVIWNQITYDIPMAIKNRQFGYLMRMVSAYAVAGIGVTAVGVAASALRGKKDDEDKWKRIFLFGSFSQFLDSAPLLGNGISAVAEQALTGERRRLYQSPMLPAAEELIEAASRVTSGDWGKALQSFAEGGALFAGLPVSAPKQGIDVIQNITGNK